MARFVLLFVGGLVPDDKQQANMNDWTDWMDRLRVDGKLVEGAPFGEPSRVISKQTKVKDYDWQHDSNVGGYCIVEVDTIDEAVQLSLNCPQLKEEYGSGRVEVRPSLTMEA